MDWYRLLPMFWYQNAPTSLEWDRALNDALDKYGATLIDAYTCRVGGCEVWIGNWPHAYGYSWSPKSCNFLPKVSTRMRLRRIVGAAIRQRKNASLSQAIASLDGDTSSPAAISLATGEQNNG